MALPPLNEETAPPGAHLNPYEVTYDLPFVMEFLGKTGESLDSYTSGGNAVVPPGVFLGSYGKLIHESYHYTTGVHVSSDMKLHSAPPVGTKARVTGNIVRLTERNGDKYVTFTVNVATADGEPIADIEHVSIYALKSRA